MRKEYEMVTVEAYVKGLDSVQYLNLEEKEVAKQVEKYLLSQKRYETNEKIVEALLA